MPRQARRRTGRGSAPSGPARARLGPRRLGALGVLGAVLLATVGLLTGIAGAAPDPATGPTTTAPAVSPTTTAPTTTPTTPTTADAPAPTTATSATPGVKSAPTPAASRSAARITPIIECTFVDTRSKQTSTVWGYRNRGSVTSVAVGDLNRFDNPRAVPGDPDGDVGQPTEFEAGRNRNVFVVTAAGESTWTLTGNELTSPEKQGTVCTANPVPVVSTGLGGLVALAVVTGVMGLVLFWRLRRPRA